MIPLWLRYSVTGQATKHHSFASAPRLTTRSRYGYNCTCVTYVALCGGTRVAGSVMPVCEASEAFLAQLTIR